MTAIETCKIDIDVKNCEGSSSVNAAEAYFDRRSSVPRSRCGARRPMGEVLTWMHQLPAQPAPQSSLDTDDAHRK